MLRPKTVIEALRANIAAAKKIREKILVANASKDRKGLSGGASSLKNILANTADISIDAGEPINVDAAKSKPGEEKRGQPPA